MFRKEKLVNSQNLLDFSSPSSLSWQDYFELGWPTIPVRYRSKRPLIKWKKFQRCAPTYENWLYWESQWSKMNLSLLCGTVSGLIGLDCDGKEALECVALRKGLPCCPGVITPRGRRWIFKIPPEGKSISPATIAGEGWSISLLGEGCLFVLPPSIHPSGTSYSWIKDMSPWEISPGDISSYLDLFPPCKPKLKSKTKVKIKPEGKILQGNRNRTIFLALTQMAKQGAPQESLRQKANSLNDQCFPPLSDLEIEAVCRSVFSFYP